MFKKAVAWDMIEQNPFDNGESLHIEANNQRVIYLTEDEIERLLDECFPSIRIIVESALNTGMRKGEILNLKWNQVRNGFIYLTETKTDSPRQIPINDDLNELFKRIKSEQNPSSNVIGLNGKPVKNFNSNYVLCKNNKPVRYVAKSFKAVTRRAGISDFRFHDLRHTFASHFVMRGGSLNDLQEILGHKTITMTLKYSHLSKEHKIKAINLLNGLTASKKAECHKSVTNTKSNSIIRTKSTG